MRREKEEVCGVVSADDVGGLDQRTVALGSLKNDLWLPDLGDAVAFHLLEHDGYGHEWSDAVSAVTSVSDAITICFVDDIHLPIDVSERRRINRATVSMWASEGFLLGDKWTPRIWTLRDCDSDTMMSVIVLHLARVVEYESSIVLKSTELEGHQLSQVFRFLLHTR